jgi:hypothetical protein
MSERPQFDLTVYDEDDETPILGDGYQGEILESSFGTHPDHPRPYLLPPRDFSQAEIDFTSGASTIGAITISILDKRQDPTDQDSGIVSTLLARIAGRRVKYRRLRAGTWRTVFDGVVHGYRIDDRNIVTVHLSVRDIRERERGQAVFTRNETFVAWGQGGAQGPAEPYGELPNGDHLLAAVPPESGAFAFQGVQEGVHYGFLPFKGDLNAQMTPGGVTVDLGAVQDLLQPQPGEGGLWNYRDLTLRWRPEGGGDWRYLRDMPRAINASILSRATTGAPGTAARMGWYVGSLDPEDLPEDSQAVEFQLLAVPTTPRTPFFWDAGTFGDLLRELYDGRHSISDPLIRYNPEALDAFAAATPRARFRLDSPENNLREWVQEHVYAPLGYAPSFDQDMRIFPIPWEFPDTEEELPELDAERIIPVGDWRHELSSVINAVRYTYIRELLPETTEEGATDPRTGRKLAPWELLEEIEVQRTRINAASAAILGVREIRYAPTTVRSIGTSSGRPVSGDSADELGEQLAGGISSSLLARFPFGAPHYTAELSTRHPDVFELTIGQWVRARPSWMPEYSLGKRGANRIMQVVGLSDIEPNRRLVHLVDGAPDDAELPETCEGCLLVEGYETEFTLGDHIYWVFLEDGGTITTLPGGEEDDPFCEVDVVLVGAGGDGGELQNTLQGQDSILWADEAGEPLDPEEDDPDPAHQAKGGGAGGKGEGVGPGIGNGMPGGSGGGGGAQSPVTFAGITAGGLGTPGQGWEGGGGRMRQGFFPTKAARTGGGGGAGSPGGTGPPWLPGPGGWAVRVVGWPSLIAGRGGRGTAEVVEGVGASTRQLGGGGGGGGVLVLQELQLQRGHEFHVTVGQGQKFEAEWGRGGDFAQAGGRGIVVVRALSGICAAAELSGGDEERELAGTTYHVFRSSGEIESEWGGCATVLAIGGGGGGASRGGGGGAGAVLLAHQVQIDPGTTLVAVGQGGAGGQGGVDGQSGGISYLGDQVEAPGGGGGAGLFELGPAADGASGGGGHADGGEGGQALLLRGHPGGDGYGYSPAAGGAEVEWAGGGGGAGGLGEDGAQYERLSDPLRDNFEGGTRFYEDETEPGLIFGERSGTTLDLVHKTLTPGDVAVQVYMRSTTGTRTTGLVVRSPGGDSTNLNGYYLRPINWGTHQPGIWLNANSGAGQLVSWASAPRDVTFPIQFYAAAGVQEGWTPYGSGAAANTTHDGRTDGRVGFWGNEPGGATGEVRHFDYLVFRTKYLTVTGLSAGDYVQVRNVAGQVVGQATASGGTALVDLFRYGGAASEPVPASGWTTLQVRNSGGSLVAELKDTIYPGGQWELDGSELLPGGANEAETYGLLYRDRFDGASPGPEQGHAGDGDEVPREFLEPEGHLFRTPSANDFRHLVASHWPSSGPSEILLEFRYLGSNTLTRLMGILRATVGSSASGYVAGLRTDGTGLELARTTSAGYVVLDTASFTPEANVTHRLRFRAVGSLLQARVWKPDSQEEPEGWQLEAVDDELPEGLPGLRIRNGAGQCLLNWVSYGAGGWPAEPWDAQEPYQKVELFPIPGELAPGWLYTWGTSPGGSGVVDMETQDWTEPVLVLDERWAGGGGGAGTTGPLFGKGGRGGGGDGSNSSSQPGENGMPDTGGGGGGSGHSAQPGGAGGDGIVIVRGWRYELEDPPEPEVEGQLLAGGTVSEHDGHVYHVFSDPGTHELERIGGGPLTVEALLVGGGGGGASSQGGGGGAGGLLYRDTLEVSGGTSYLVVGAGGAGGVGSNRGANGGATSYGSHVASGGGGGDTRNAAAGGRSGGSGGGGANSSSGGSGVAGQGHRGGDSIGVQVGGGGGGAGEPGQDTPFYASSSPNNEGGDGGDGLQFSQFSAVGGAPAGWFAGGGGGGCYNGDPGDQSKRGIGGQGGGGDGSARGDTPPVAGAANTGGGGGAGGGPNATVPGAPGGSGVVILRYPKDGGAG